jgi:hypothetical protein
MYSNQRKRSRNYDNYGSQDTEKIIIKEKTAETQGIETMVEKTWAAPGSFSQED